LLVIFVAIIYPVELLPFKVKTLAYLLLPGDLTFPMARAWLIEQGFDPDGDLCLAIPIKRTPWTVATAIHEASRAGERGVCQWLYDHGAATTLRTTDRDGKTPMLAACEKGHLPVTKWLFEVGAAEDIRAKDEGGVTPMMQACWKGHLDVAKWLFEVGAAEDIRTKHSQGGTPMLLACFAGHLHLAKWLFEVGAAEDIRTKSDLENTPMLRSCQEGHLDVAKWLFEVGAAEDIRSKNNRGDTPMMQACWKGHIGVAKWLFEAGAAEDMHGCANDGRTPIRHAAENCQHATVAWLVLQGAANDSSGHVDASILKRDVNQCQRVALRENLTAVFDQHSAVTRLVLPATRNAQAAFAGAPPSARSALRSNKPCAPQVPSPLALLCGHEDTLLALIADFVGVVRGRQLRNAREAAAIFDAIEHIGGGGGRGGGGGGLCMRFGEVSTRKTGSREERNG
jgi:ankyrin repeat protein